MFRDPRRRIHSAFNHFRHSFGLGPAAREQLLRNASTLLEYLSFPRIQSCQARMLLGQYCAGPMTVDAAATAMAIERLDTHFAFVGLMEYWNESICLFHRIYGVPVHPSEFLNTRPTNEHLAKMRAGNVYVSPPDGWQSLTPAHDPHDWAVWTHARRLLRSKLEEYGMIVPETLRQPAEDLR